VQIAEVIPETHERSNDTYVYLILSISAAISSLYSLSDLGKVQLQYNEFHGVDCSSKEEENAGNDGLEQRTCGRAVRYVLLSVSPTLQHS
jgi:hypothetical protein